MCTIENYKELEFSYKAAQRRLFFTKPLDPDRQAVVEAAEEALAALVRFEREHPELAEEIWAHCHPE